MKTPYDKAIDLYNETLGRSWGRDDFTEELQKRDMSEDEALMAYLKLRYQLKTTDS